jgi:hypothetical protein
VGKAFIIMQIGNDELDEVCEKAIVPAIEACSLEATRVDKHSEGGLLKSEIIGCIESADIIVADLTNERPNCYLEVGYAMGVDKFRNLILTVREDHSLDSANHEAGGPKIHFDLSGYDILHWRSDTLDEFRAELEKRIRRRLAIITPSVEPASGPWSEDWVSRHREAASSALNESGHRGYMEIRFALDHPKPHWSQQQLNDSAREATIHTFGWPIAIYLQNREEFRPRPRADGIVAEIRGDLRNTYDYWAIKRDGDFYLLKTLFEDYRDESNQGLIFFNTRIVRVTEALLYCARLYSRLGVGAERTVSIVIKHGGLRDRVLGSSGSRPLHYPRTTSEDEIETAVRVTFGEIEADLTRIVKDLVSPLLMVFDFFELGDEVYDDIVSKFVRGEVS